MFNGENGDENGIENAPPAGPRQKLHGALGQFHHLGWKIHGAMRSCDSEMLSLSLTARKKRFYTSQPPETPTRNQQVRPMSFTLLAFSSCQN